ncbi:hypothetical protein V8C86DRAFT_3129151 [Haematococcus lacustris]
MLGPQLRMRPLPSLETPSSLTLTPPPLDWEAAAGNLEDSKLAVQAIKDLVSDAVFLDEEAFMGAVSLASLYNKIQAQQRRMRDMEHEALALQAEVEAKDRALSAANATAKDRQALVAQLQQELDNNSVVFKMHFSELITRNEEIARLKAMVEGLQQQLGTQQEQMAEQLALQQADHAAQLAQLQGQHLQPPQEGGAGQAGQGPAAAAAAGGAAGAGGPSARTAWSWLSRAAPPRQRTPPPPPPTPGPPPLPSSTPPPRDSPLPPTPSPTPFTPSPTPSELPDPQKGGMQAQGQAGTLPQPSQTTAPTAPQPDQALPSPAPPAPPPPPPLPDRQREPLPLPQPAAPGASSPGTMPTASNPARQSLLAPQQQVVGGTADTALSAGAAHVPPASPPVPPTAASQRVFPHTASAGAAYRSHTQSGGSAREPEEEEEVAVITSWRDGGRQPGAAHLTQAQHGMGLGMQAWQQGQGGEEEEDVIDFGSADEEGDLGADSADRDLCA